MYSEIDKQGWKCALEGSVRADSKGYYIEPAIIDNPPEDSRIVIEEPFGPIVPLLKWNDEDDVIERLMRCGLASARVRLEQRCLTR